MRNNFTIDDNYSAGRYVRTSNFVFVNGRFSINSKTSELHLQAFNPVLKVD